MADIIISFRSVNQLYDCLIFTKELSKVTFDTDTALQVVFNYEHFDMNGNSSCDNCQNIAVHFPERLLTNHIHCGRSELFEDVSHNVRVVNREFSDVSMNNNSSVYLCVNASKTCILLMNAHLACCVAKYIKTDRVFRHRFWKFTRKHFRFIPSMDTSFWIKKSNGCGYLNVPYSIDIVSVWPKQKIDYAWNRRIQHQVNKRCHLEESMAWLSTLGGGYSSLGDYFSYCAQKAGEISITQLKLAIEMSDPIMASKCRVFWAQSLLQLGYLKQCRKIVWREYQSMKSNGTRDMKLANMCYSVWNRLKYLYSIRQGENKKQKS